MEMLCEAERQSDAVGIFPVDERLEHLRRFFDRQLSHPEVRALIFDRVANAAPKARAALIEAAASDVGLERCVLAALLGWAAEPGSLSCEAACVERHGAHDDIGMRAECARGCHPPRRSEHAP